MPTTIIPAVPAASSTSSGTVTLAGDLAGTGSAAATPRVGRITGETLPVLGQGALMRDGAFLGFAAADATTGLPLVGDTRFRNGRILAAVKNGAGTADLAVMEATAGNLLYLGCASDGTKGFAAVNVFANSGVNIGTTAGAAMSVSSSTVTLSANVQLVLTTASVGIKFGTGATAPTITTGAGAPAAAAQNGSLYLRTDGAASTTAYVRIAGNWVPLLN